MKRPIASFESAPNTIDELRQAMENIVKCRDIANTCQRLDFQNLPLYRCGSREISERAKRALVRACWWTFCELAKQSGKPTQRLIADIQKWPTLWRDDNYEGYPAYILEMQLAFVECP